jgi:4-aminobutyrate aminotransferase-like enzyme
MAKDFEFNLTPRSVTPIQTENRTICTKIPVPESIEIIKKSMKFQSVSMNHQLPAIWDRAVGSSIYDPYGNKWIDFSSSIFINNVGHGNSFIIKSIRDMLDKPLLCSYGYYTAERADFAEYLISIMDPVFEKVCFFSTGTDATEAALKTSRLFGIQKGKKYTISFLGGFHGKTMGAQNMSGNPTGIKWAIEVNPYIYHLPYPGDPFLSDEELEDDAYGRSLFLDHLKVLEADGITPESISSFIFEPYQGWGAIFYPKGYIKSMREFADKYGCLIICDEVQSGFGRTGKLFAYEHYDIVPDIVCCGKAISGAMPLSAVVTRAEIIDVEPTLSSTHGGNPISCASSMANLKYLIENNLVGECAKKETFVRKAFNGYMHKYGEKIKQIHGRGLAFAAIFCKPGTKERDIEIVERIIERAFEKGLMSIRTSTGTIKIGPPLNISESALKEGLEIIDESIAEILGET